MIGDLEEDFTLEIPDVAEPIRAFRCFSALWVPDGTWVIQSPSQSTTWPPLREVDSFSRRGEGQRDYLTAKCAGTTAYAKDPDFHGSKHPCPSPPGEASIHAGSGCGIYGYKSMSGLMKDWALVGVPEGYATSPSWASSLAFVWGTCLMWGKVFSHESGYRGEFARIDSFFDVEGAGKVKGRTLEKLSEFYGAPIIQVSREQLFDAIDEMCEINRDRPMWLRKLDRKKVALSNRAGNYLARTLSHMLP